MKKRLHSRLTMSLVALFSVATLFAQVLPQGSTSVEQNFRTVNKESNLILKKNFEETTFKIERVNNTSKVSSILKGKNRNELQIPIEAVYRTQAKAPDINYIYYEDFDGATTSTWTCFDVDNRIPADQINEAYPGLQGKGWLIGSTNYGKSLYATSYYADEGKADDWAISPAITIPSSDQDVNLYWIGFSIDKNFKESYEVRVFETLPTNATGLEANSTLLSTINEEEGYPRNGDCNRHISLNDYKGKTIYVAYRLTSADKFLCGIDNVSVLEGVLPITPIAFYDTPIGMYPMSAEIGPGGEPYGPGFLAPVDSKITFSAEGSSNADSYNWIFENVEGASEDGILTLTSKEATVSYPYPMDAFTPELKVISSDGIASDFYSNGEKLQVGANAMIYNVDPYATATASSIVDYLSLLKSNSGYAFGYDSANKPLYIEMFDEPKPSIYLGGFAALLYSETAGTANFNFGLYIAGEDGKFDLSVEPIVTEQATAEFETAESTAIAQVQFSEFTFVDKPFLIMISGPQDGSCKWSLLSQIGDTRLTTKNTIFVTPTIGSNAGKILSYDINTSTTLYTVGVQPFIVNLIEEDSKFYYMNSSIMGLPNEGGVLPLNIQDVFAGKVTLTSNNDWLKISDLTYNSENKMNSYTLTLDPSDVDRIGSITATDSKGKFTKTFYFGQGAGTGISDIQTLGKVNVVCIDNAFSVSYPEGMASVEVVNVAGQKVATYNLEGTSATIPAAGLANGLYLLRFNDGTTVKVMK